MLQSQEEKDPLLKFKSGSLLWRVVSQILFQAIIYLCPALGLGKGTSSVQFAGCSRGDCPFHPFFFFRKKKDSSLLLSQGVNSPYAFHKEGPALPGDSLRCPSCLCAVWTFLPPNRRAIALSPKQSYFTKKEEIYQKINGSAAVLLRLSMLNKQELPSTLQ